MKAGNPYLTALKVITVLTMASAIILLLIGSRMMAQQPWSSFSGFAGLAELAWSAGLFGTGLMSLFAWLAAAAVLRGAQTAEARGGNSAVAADQASQ